MTRRSCLPHRLTPLPLAALLVGSLWLSGCASQAERAGDDAPNPADAYTQLGLAYLERDNLSRAMAALDRALEIAPEDSEALQAMAVAYQRQGEEELADEAFQKALRSNPDFTQARNNYAAFLYGQGRIEAACDQLRRASKDAQYPRRAQLFANLGRCLHQQGEVEAARESLERAQRLDPRYAASYLILARLELSRGNLERAGQELDQYRRLAGSTPAARELESDIAAARAADSATTHRPLINDS